MKQFLNIKNYKIPLKDFVFLIICISSYIPFMNYNLFNKLVIVSGVWDVFLILVMFFVGLIGHVKARFLKEHWRILIACTILVFDFLLGRLAISMFINYIIVLLTVPCILCVVNSKNSIFIFAYSTIIFGVIFSLVSKDWFNPNSVGMLMYICSGMAIVLYKLKKNKIFFALAVYFFVQVYLSVSRSSILALLLLILLCWKGRLIFRKKLLFNIFNMAIFSLLLIIPCVYMFFYYKRLNFELFGLNKTIYSGREMIWLQYINLLNNNKSWLTGLSNYYEVDVIGYNLHNSLFGIIVALGIPVAILFFHNLLLVCRKSYCRIAKDEVKQLCYFIFCGLLIINSMETAMITYSYAFIMFFALGFACKKENFSVSEGKMA